MSSEILATPARVAVVDCAIEIQAPREEVYRAFLHRPSEWFCDRSQTPPEQPCILEPVLGGRMFLRTRANGDENLMAFVTLLKENREVRLRGDFTVPQAFVANVTIRFEDIDGGTRVSIHHRMAGDFSDDMPPGFDEGWTDALRQLKEIIEG